MINIKWHNYYMNIAIAASMKSQCLSPKKGAIIVNDQGVIIATGFNGSPSKVKSCAEIGKCNKREAGYNHGTGNDKCLAIHAEVNAIINAAKTTISTQNSTMYCTHKPCLDCTKILINSGISVVFYKEDYKTIIPFKIPDHIEFRKLISAL